MSTLVILGSTSLPTGQQADYSPTETVYRHSDQTDHVSTSHYYFLVGQQPQEKYKNRFDAEYGGLV